MNRIIKIFKFISSLFHKHTFKYIFWDFFNDMNGAVGPGIYIHKGWVVSKWKCSDCDAEKIIRERRVDDYDRDYPKKGFVPVGLIHI